MFLVFFQLIMQFIIAEDADWVKNLITDKVTRDHYQLMLPNFIEAIIRIAVAVYQKKGLQREPLSVVIDNYIRTTMRNDCITMEGQVLLDQTKCNEVQEILNYYREKLNELYDKIKIPDWKPMDNEHYESFGKISLLGIFFVFITRKLKNILIS